MESWILLLITSSYTLLVTNTSSTLCLLDRRELRGFAWKGTNYKPAFPHAAFIQCIWLVSLLCAVKCQGLMSIRLIFIYISIYIYTHRYICKYYPYFFESPTQIKGAWKNKFFIVLNPPCLDKYFLPLLYGALILCNVWRILHILWKMWCSSQLSHRSVWERAGHNHSVQQWLQTVSQKALMWEWRSQWGKLKFQGQETKAESFLIFSSQEAGLYLLLVEQDPSMDQVWHP